MFCKFGIYVYTHIWRMFMDDMKLTSVKILKSLYDNFKITTVNTKMTLQKITNRSLYHYLNDEAFREKINTTDDLFTSGSNL